MRGVRITAVSMIVSFRDPRTHKFQRSYPLPPPTTIKGLLGAALGLTPDKANDLPVLVSVSIKETTCNFRVNQSGFTTDLWKYDKWKVNQFDTKGVVKRDIFYRKDFEIYIVTKDESILSTERIRDAFYNPSWALSLGRDDEIIKIAQIRMVQLNETKVAKFENTLLPFDVKERGGKPCPEDIQKFLKGEIVSLEPPLIVSLPSRFAYNLEKGIREGVDIHAYSFIGKNGIVLSESVEGVVDEEQNRNIMLC